MRRQILVSVTFLAAMLGCTPERPKTAPYPEMRAAIEWRNASVVNRSIDSFIWQGMFFWGAWQISGDLTVVEDGVSSVWQAIAFDAKIAGVVDPGPCRSDGAITIYAWRPLADSLGIEAIFINLQKPLDLDRATFGSWGPCPGDSGSLAPAILNRGTHRAGGVASGGTTAVAGQAHVGVAGSAEVPCPTASGLPWGDLECTGIRVAVTVAATLSTIGPEGKPIGPERRIVIGPSVVPGQRRAFPCQDLLRCRRADPQQLPAKVGYGPYFSKHFVTIWRGDTVHRNLVHVRLAPGTEDATILRTLSMWQARADTRGPAGDLRVQVPDPGPGPGAFDRLIARLSATPGVDLVLPIRVDNWLPAAPPGRLEITVAAKVDDPGASHVCVGGLLWSPDWFKSPWCRPVVDGAAVFDSLPTTDYLAFAACTDTTRTGRPAADSIPVPIAPGATTKLRLQMRVSCGRR